MGLPQEQPGGKQGGTENQGLGTFTAVVVVMFMGVGRLRMVVLVGMFGMVMVVMMMLVVIVATAAIFAVFVMVRFVVVMATAAIFAVFVMVMFVVVVTTAAILIVFVMVMLVVVVAAAAIFAVIVMVMLVVVVPTTTAFSVFVVGAAVGVPGGSIPGIDHHFVLDGSGNLRQLGDQGIGILRSDPQLLGGKGDGGFLHLFVGVEFALNFGGAVGAVQIVNDVDLLFHGRSSFEELTYEQSFR